MQALSDRAHYPSLGQGAYLNQASLGLIGQPAVAAMHAFLDDVARHGNMNLTDAQEVGLFTPLRDRAAALMNCQPEQLAIIGSAGEMLSNAPYLFRPAPGGNIVAVATDFPALTRPWLAQAREQRLTMKFVDDAPDHDLTDALIHAIDDQTSVVLASYVQFSTGAMVDCIRLRQAANRVGARLIIDVTQAAGAVPIDAAAWGADLIVCSGYKWLGGHGGVGLAVLAPDLLAETPPAPGWMGAPDPFDMQATKLPLASGAARYTQSTMSYISIIGLTAAMADLQKLGAQNIARHGAALAALLLDQTADNGWSAYRPPGRGASSHIVTLGHDSADAQETLAALRRAGVTCSVRNGRVRVSLAHYNDAGDVAALASALNPAAA